MEVREPSAKYLVGAMQKQTEVGLIPQDWAVCEVAQAFDICNQLRLPLSRAIRSGMSGPYPYYGPTGPQDWINEFRLEGEYALIGEDGDHFLKWKNQPMTLLVRGRFNVNNHAHVVKAIAENHTDWFRWFFANRDITQYLTRQGASRYKLTKATLARLPCALPSPTEQRAISTALTDADALIDSLEQLLTKKRQIKQGAMQELLTGQRRLPGHTSPWIPRRIGSFAPLQRGFDLPSRARRLGEYPVVYSNGILNFHSGFRVQGPGVVTGRSGTIGTVTFVEQNYWPHNTALWVTGFNGSDPRFVFYLFQHIGLDRFASGSGVPTLNRNDVHAFEVHVPVSVGEQAEIAQALSDIDTELTALESRLTKARALKQAMAQALLTGRIRLLPAA